MATPMSRGAVEKLKQKFSYCELCRHSHVMGKRHAFCRRHRDKVKAVLAKFGAKVKLAKQDMKEPCLVTGSFEADVKFWCYMCGCEVSKHVSDGEVTVRHAGFIEHLMSTEHAQKVDRFWRANRIETDLQPKFVFSDGDGRDSYRKVVESALTRHEEREERLLSQSAAKIRKLESNRAESLPPSSSSISVPRPPETVAATSSSDVAASNGGRRPMAGAAAVPPGIRRAGEAGVADGYEVLGQGGVHGPAVAHGSGQDPAGARAGRFPAAGQPPLKPGSLSKVRTIGVISSGGLTAVNVKDGRAAGNVHTGARPPWLRNDEAEPEGAGRRDVGPTEADFRKHLEQQRKSRLNPGRVGADFDRASLAPEGEWLPSFGRVWNAGRRLQSRRQYRKEASQSKGWKGRRPAPSTATKPPQR